MLYSIFFKKYRMEDQNMEQINDIIENLNLDFFLKKKYINNYFNYRLHFSRNDDLFCKLVYKIKIDHDFIPENINSSVDYILSHLEKLRDFDKFIGIIQIKFNIKITFHTCKVRSINFKEYFDYKNLGKIISKIYDLDQNIHIHFKIKMHTNFENNPLILTELKQSLYNYFLSKSAYELHECFNISFDENIEERYIPLENFKLKLDKQAIFYNNKFNTFETQINVTQEYIRISSEFAIYNLCLTMCFDEKCSGILKDAELFIENNFSENVFPNCEFPENNFPDDKNPFLVVLDIIFVYSNNVENHTKMIKQIGNCVTLFCQLVEKFKGNTNVNFKLFNICDKVQDDSYIKIQEGNCIKAQNENYIKSQDGIYIKVQDEEYVEEFIKNIIDPEDNNLINYEFSYGLKELEQ